MKFKEINKKLESVYGELNQLRVEDLASVNIKDHEEFSKILLKITEIKQIIFGSINHFELSMGNKTNYLISIDKEVQDIILTFPGINKKRILKITNYTEGKVNRTLDRLVSKCLIKREYGIQNKLTYFILNDENKPEDAKMGERDRT